MVGRGGFRPGWRIGFYRLWEITAQVGVEYENQKRERDRKPKRVLVPVIVLVLGCGEAPQNRTSSHSVPRLDMQHGFAALVRSKLASFAVPIRSDVAVTKAATCVTGPLDSPVARDLDARMKFAWALVGGGG
jgi:hypothetical protein